ncbi:MAG: hypothetical protein ACE5GK_09310 [Nitrospiria bacterium]
MIKKTTPLFIAMILWSGLAACSSGGGGSTQGLSLPTEISAVPTNQSSGASKTLQVGMKSTLLGLKAATDAGTDYSGAVTQKYVNEHTLEQFEIIEQVLGALAQTHYDDVSNIGKGPYKAMVAWQDEQNGIETKRLQPWVVQSDIVSENGQTVTRARAWIEEVEGGQKELIKAEFKIYASATQAADGSYMDYGVWTLNVKFGESATDFFAASAELGPNGGSIIRIHERFPEGPGFVFEVKAILNKSAANGFGKVSFPDWESCTDHPCAPSIVEAKYAYNEGHLAIQKSGDPSPTFKNRASVTEMTHRYGLFDSVTGADIMKAKSFGFPLVYSGSAGFNEYAYYGAWQGRHQIWAGESGLPTGTLVTREDHNGNTSPETYTVSAPFKGTLTKRTPVPASLSDVQDIPVETWVNNDFMLVFDNAVAAGKWAMCKDPSWSPTLTCGTGSAEYTDFASIVYDEKNPRRSVWISRWDSGLGQNFNYAYLPAGHPSASSGAGFYQATDVGGSFLFGSLYTPTSGHEIWVNIGGSIYIEYKGAATGWVQKTMSGFDQRTWTPEFDPSGDTPYTLPLDREIYINSKGANYIVERSSGGTTVQIELQAAANPLNATTFVPSGTEFKEEWVDWTDTSQSVFEFVTDSASPKYMKLVYKTIGSNDTGLLNEAGTAVSGGDVVNRNFWGLKARVGTTESSTQYNWDYPREGENWGIVQYLIDANGAFVLLSDPVQLTPLTLANNAGIQKTLSLQYDGWMHGLPDLFEELRKKDFVIDATIADKIINIPAGTVANDAIDPSKSYLIKPLEISQFLNLVADPGTLDITVADGVDLSTVPNFVEHGMGDIPVVDLPKYSEGVLIQ